MIAMVCTCDAKGGYPHNYSTLSMKVTGTIPRGRPKMRWLDRLKNDMRIYGTNPEMVTDGERWSLTVKNVNTT